MPPRELFTQATGPTEASPPYGQPPGPPVQTTQFSPPAAYQQQYQQPSSAQGYPNANSYPYAAQQVQSPGQGQAYPPPTNSPGAHPYAPQQPQHQPSFSVQQQGFPQGYPGPPQSSTYSPGINQNQIQDPSPPFPQDVKTASPVTETPPPIAQPSPSPFPAVRDPYQQNNAMSGYASYTQQPGAGPVMTMDPKNAKGLPRDQAGEREWSNGICGCMDDCGTCCLAWFCPCMVYSQVKTRLSHLETQGRPHPEGGDMFASDCFVHGLLTCCGFGWVLQIGSRGSIRDRYRIGGNGCTDCLAAWCCTPCELTQESQEITLEERALTGKPIKA